MIEGSGMDGNTSIVDALVQELQGKTTVTESFPRKVAAPVSTVSSRLKDAIKLLALWREVLVHFCKVLVGSIVTGIGGALPPPGGRREITPFIGLCGFDGLTQLSHRSNKALVDTCVP